MELKDFEKTPDLLIGKTVLYEYGKSYSPNLNKEIVKIEKVTKTGFKISSRPDVLFKFFDGRQKGLNGRMDVGTISRCTLISEEIAEQIKEQWKINREKKELKEKMKIKLETMTFDELKKMELI